MRPKGEEVYIHRAVIVPRGRRGGDVYNSVEEAPERVRRLIERGSTFTIVIADRNARERMEGKQAVREPGEAAIVPAAFVREIMACLAVAALIGWFAMSR